MNVAGGLVPAFHSRYRDYSTQDHLLEHNLRFDVDITIFFEEAGEHLRKYWRNDNQNVYHYHDVDNYTIFLYVRSMSIPSEALFLAALISMCLMFATVLTYYFNHRNVVVRAFSLHAGWMDLSNVGGMSRHGALMRIVFTSLLVCLHCKNSMLHVQRRVVFHAALYGAFVRLNTAFNVICCYYICASNTRHSASVTQLETRNNKFDTFRWLQGGVFRFIKELFRKWIRLGPLCIAWSLLFIYFTTVVPLFQWRDHSGFRYYSDGEHVCAQPGPFMASVLFVFKIFYPGESTPCHNMGIYESQFHVMAVLLVVRSFVTSERKRFLASLFLYLALCLWDLYGRVFEGQGERVFASWQLRHNRDLLAGGVLVQVIMSALAILREDGNAAVNKFMRSYLNVRMCGLYLVVSMLFLLPLDFIKFLREEQIFEPETPLGGKSFGASHVLAPASAMVFRVDQRLCALIGWRLFDRITEFPYVFFMALWLDRVHKNSKDHKIQEASQWQAVCSKLSWGVNAGHGFVIGFLKGFYNLMDAELTVFSFASVCFGTIFWSFAASLVTYVLVEHPVNIFYNALVVGQRVGQFSKSSQKSDAAYDRMVQARALRRTRSEVD